MPLFVFMKGSRGNRINVNVFNPFSASIFKYGARTLTEHHLPMVVQTEKAMLFVQQNHVDGLHCLQGGLSQENTHSVQGIINAFLTPVLPRSWISGTIW